MTQRSKIRLSQFAEATGWERAAFRTILAEGRPPFRVSRIEGEEQLYGGKEVFAMMLFTILTRGGMRQEWAALDIVRSGCVEAFFDALEAGEHSDLCLVLPDNAPPKVMAPVLPPTVMQAADIARYVANAIESTENREDGGTYLRSVRIVPLAPAYRAAQALAKDGGYQLDGLAIWKIDTDEGAE